MNSRLITMDLDLNGTYAGKANCFALLQFVQLMFSEDLMNVLDFKVEDIDVPIVVPFSNKYAGPAQ